MHIDRYVTINVFFPKIQNGVKLSQIELKIDFKSPMPYWSQLHDILVLGQLGVAAGIQFRE